MPQSHTCNSTCRRLGHVIYFYSQLNSDLISQTLCVSSHDTLVGPFVLSCVESFTTFPYMYSLLSNAEHSVARGCLDRLQIKLPRQQILNLGGRGRPNQRGS